MRLFKEALQKIQEIALRNQAPKGLSTESRPIQQALGKILASDVIGHEAIPPFDNSSMDGFAVRAAITQKASRAASLRLPVLGSLAAGDVPEGSDEGFGVWEIMTGAPLPTSCDCVIRIEDAKLEKNAAGQVVAIEIHQPVEAKTFVRARGSDFAQGQVILKKGARLEAQHILPLASLGIAEVPVLRAVKVARLSTGKELVNHGQRPGPGQIRNSTAPYFDSVLPRLDMEVVMEESVGDEPADFRRALEKALAMKVDLILTTGAVSMGKYDFVPDEIKKQNAQIHFHKVAMQPGKPLLFASFESGPVLFGLPGNPVSGMVGLRFFVETYVRCLREQGIEKPLTIRLAKDTKKPEGLRQFAKAILHFSEGQATVEVLAGQMSYMLSPLLQANCWAVLPEGPAQLSAGTLVDTYPLFSN